MKLAAAERVAQGATSAYPVGMIYAIHFLRWREGRTEPEVMEMANYHALNLEAAKHLALRTWQATALAAGAHGYKIVENGEREVFSWRED